ncbi:hypothetical protein DR864_28475 (plasmid) [Runella rosea]|uniref:Uncharacterized protein n=1 Tax=Runella rosea TaxID=2259595 RepID=A0A344TT40_9BACT|nr:hypothetical protein [Runella rosea]AXE21811.1 hypothetical protein DR864_28475 [Runella rosea]
MLITEITGLSTDNQLRGNGSLRIILQEFSQKSNNFDSEIKSSYLKDIRQSSQRVISLFSMDNVTYKNIILGLQNLDCNKCKLTESDLYDERAENLKTSLAAVEELYIVSESLVKGQPNLQSAVDGLKSFRNELLDLITDFADISAARKAIKDNIFEIGLGPVFALGGSTFIFSFETRNKLSLAPDFGLVTTRIGNDGSNPYGFVPYFGFHVNFRPINRDVPFKSYNHKPFHYGSLFIGWSLVSIDNGPKQSAGADSVASFFSKGKGTFINWFRHPLRQCC